MTQPSFAALLFLPFVLPICVWVAWSDMSRMKIPNKSVLALLAVFVVGGIFLMPFTDYLWHLGVGIVVLLAGIVLNAAGSIGAGDAKFAAAAAPFIAFGDLRFVLALFAANLLAAFATHRIARATPLRKMAPEWESWSRGWDFPMGLALGSTLAIYLLLKAFFLG